MIFAKFYNLYFNCITPSHIEIKLIFDMLIMEKCAILVKGNFLSYKDYTEIIQ